MNSTFIDALNNRVHSHIPAWYMRQAGRHMPGFAKHIANNDLSKIVRSPQLASEIAIEAVERLDVDAAIMFSDIVTPLQEAGLQYVYTVGAGPQLKTPISLNRFIDAVSNMRAENLWFIRDQIMEIKRSTDVPVIGFAGAPFTLVSYIIEGKYAREFPKTKSFMMTENWNMLIKAVIDLIIKDVDVQIDAGASVIQLFDTWMGILSERQFSEYYSSKLFELVSHIKNRVPVIYFCTDCSHLINKVVRSIKPTVMSVDWKISLKSIHDTEKIGLQGNLDPVYSLIGGQTMIKEADIVLEDARGINNYVFNLGHGVLPGTDWRELKKLTEHVHRWKF
ncbi:MAG: uroporphyrinogen decarboxylase [Nitrososphaerota archaeon]|nr:uroporphyrinogen decarboxylase [Nitrososphaerota archaeon]